MNEDSPLADTLIWVLVAIALVLFLTLGVSEDEPREYRIPCEVSEISPDFTNEMREYCRLQRQKQLRDYTWIPIPNPWA
jgi:hypothetical protein